MSLRNLLLAFVLIPATSSIVSTAPGYEDRTEGVTVPCIVGRTAPPVGFWTWPAHTRVNVYLRQPDFSEGDAAAVRVAVQNWDATATENGSNVHFIFHGLTSETRIAQGEMTIIRKAVYDKKLRQRALLEAHSRQRDRFIDYALILVDPSVKDPGLLTNVVAHELGHSLGLLDCYKCRSRSTAMGLLKAGNESNGIEGPTPCDKRGVTAAYEGLKPRSMSPPLSLSLNRLREGQGESLRR